MSFGILGKKLGMTQIFEDDGTCVPVTVVQAGPCRVLQIKMVAAGEHPEGHRSITGNRGKKTGRRALPRRPDGYYAVQLGFDDQPVRTSNKAELGHAKKAGAETAKRFVREFRLDKAPEVKAGDDVTVTLFEGVLTVDVTGITKGRGFQGVMKRWDFRGFGQTHGTHEYRRHPGAIGQRKTPGRVYPNKKLPGHYGVEQVTTQNLEVVALHPEKNLILVKGGVAGPNDGVVIIKPSVKLALRAAHKAKTAK